MGMDTRFKIADIGVEAALRKLLPFVRSAGRLAHRLQPQIKAMGRGEKGGSFFASALTAADLLLEDRLGGDILGLFRDARFYGEEHQIDQISRFFPDDAPFIITLDPINGTAYYRDGLPQYEEIVTICDHNWEMMGSLVYLPAEDRGYIAYLDRFETPHVQRFGVSGGRQPQAEFAFTPYRLPTDSARAVYLDEAYSVRAHIVEAAGYEAIFPWRDYRGQPDWKHASSGILTGLCRGILNPNAQIIDAEAFGFIAAAAGGHWEAGVLDRETKRYEYGLSATDLEVTELLRRVMER